MAMLMDSDNRLTVSSIKMLPIIGFPFHLRRNKMAKTTLFGLDINVT
uniref:Uncharacterized protein n=1 Tax=Tetranychus urticae TaxID=32264 RepID=T1JY01_TETUR